MSIDTDIVVWVNGHHSAFLDDFMWTVSTPTTWIPLYVLLLVLLGFAYKRKTWSGTMHTLFTILIGFAIAVALSDYISSGILKPLICRLRPTHDGSVPLLHLVNGYKGGMYGFCSSHAANSMAVALLFSLLYRKKIATILLMLWVALVCYSRIYLGVHFPTDIIAGLFVGSLMAVVVWVTLTLVFHVDDEDLLRDDS